MGDDGELTREAPFRKVIADEAKRRIREGAEPTAILADVIRIAADMISAEPRAAVRAQLVEDAVEGLRRWAVRFADRRLRSEPVFQAAVLAAAPATDGEGSDRQ